MGKRFELAVECAYCGKVEEEAYYAPTCNFFGFECKKCGKYNFITTDLKSKKVEDVNYNDVYWAVNNASNMMNEEQIKSCAKEFYRKLKRKWKY